MNPAAVILSVLFFTSAILCVTMTLAWQHFGRQRHVLFWAMSYGLSVLQWVFNAGGIALRNPILLAMASTTIILSSSLVAIGARDRARLPIRWSHFAIGGGAAIVGGIIAFSPWGTLAMQGVIASSYAGGMMAAAAFAVCQRGRPATQPERAFFVVLVVFALFQAVVAGVGWQLGRPPLAHGLTIYRFILGLGLPAIYVATGVTAILLIAGDLALQLRQEVSHDALTGLSNRRGLEEQGGKAIANARRHKQRLSAVICDMDCFKAVNDGYGHIVGDAALRAFARVLLGAVRKEDVAGRLGGDEFCVLLLNAGEQDAAEVMERVRAGVSLLAIDRLPSGSISASFGIAELAESDDGLNDLIARADRALYESKQQGKNRVTIWSDAA